ncbi:hypothetical protein O5404_07730 (plasmid) [Borrelia miyamotoi]|uniref:Uncharacterized protein n=1 Tax=Borrelia miyamotoi TaxID=47466 RepID=A0AAX3JQ80_9SPIR|nr:hypothetical protein [Borrelia miyamotoi]WAZ72894.1 hypothetical protein O5404_07730 [Borrelia miyamotoi]WVI05723.1 hypothetical protein F9Y91_02590 [Borrelia miyamotoi]
MRKAIKFPKKKKSFRDEEKEIEEFIEQVDANIEQMDREFKEFQRRYGEDKSFDDWMAYEEEKKKKKDIKIQLRIDNLSSRFEKELNSKMIDDKCPCDNVLDYCDNLEDLDDSDLPF